MNNQPTTTTPDLSGTSIRTASQTKYFNYQISAKKSVSELGTRGEVGLLLNYKNPAAPSGWSSMQVKGFEGHPIGAKIKNTKIGDTLELQFRDRSNPHAIHSLELSRVGWGKDGEVQGLGAVTADGKPSSWSKALLYASAMHYAQQSGLAMSVSIYPKSIKKTEKGEFWEIAHYLEFIDETSSPATRRAAIWEVWAAGTFHAFTPYQAEVKKTAKGWKTISDNSEHILGELVELCKKINPHAATPETPEESATFEDEDELPY